jgi:hypothetical protein
MKFRKEVMTLKTISILLFNPVAATISKWRTFTFLSLAQILNQLVDLDQILYEDDGIEYCFL